MSCINKHQAKGFTLLEILIALFIFSIVSTILVGALHSSMGAQAETEKNAARFRELQMAWLVSSHDFEQILVRPILNDDGQQEASFIGTDNEVTFTHAGWTNPDGQQARTTLQRTHYYVKNNILYRQYWLELDRTSKTPSHARRLLYNVSELRLEYLDANKKFQNVWPPPEGKDELPQAVRMNLIFTDGNKMSFLYVIPATVKIQ